MKTFISPKINIVYLSPADMIATSGGPSDGSGFGDPDGDMGDGARLRHNPIWDDYE